MTPSHPIGGQVCAQKWQELLPPQCCSEKMEIWGNFLFYELLQGRKGLVLFKRLCKTSINTKFLKKDTRMESHQHFEIDGSVK